MRERERKLFLPEIEANEWRKKSVNQIISVCFVPFFAVVVVVVAASGWDDFVS
jgi:hypothetical protein